MRAPTWRAEKIKGRLALAYGNDHVCGKFIQVWRLTDPGRPTDWIENQPDHDNMLLDRDEFFGSLTEQQMIRLAAEHGFKLTREDLN